MVWHSFLMSESLTNCMVPETQILRDYQTEGVQFLKDVLGDPQKGGAILADEMGLGKTSMCGTVFINNIILNVNISSGTQTYCGNF